MTGNVTDTSCVACPSPFSISRPSKGIPSGARCP
ncbi:hypothetical protein SALBM135S_07452 [Streptomyces alboniger]